MRAGGLWGPQLPLPACTRPRGWVCLGADVAPRCAAGGPQRSREPGGVSLPRGPFQPGGGSHRVPHGEREHAGPTQPGAPLGLRGEGRAGTRHADRQREKRPRPRDAADTLPSGSARARRGQSLVTTSPKPRPGRSRQNAAPETELSVGQGPPTSRDTAHGRPQRREGPRPAVGTQAPPRRPAKPPRPPVTSPEAHAPGPDTLSAALPGRRGPGSRPPSCGLV